MKYKSTADLVKDLEKHNKLIRIKKEVDPNLEMAAIHLRVNQAGGPAILFENVKGSPFPAVSNLFGTMERAEFIFRGSLKNVKNLMKLKADPVRIFKKPLDYLSLPKVLLNALPKRSIFRKPVLYGETTLDKIPQIKSWKNDGGAFLTLPQVYTEDPNKKNIFNSNLGMYRIQISGNDYIQNEEAGVHYQIQRGIGVHQTEAVRKNEPLKVSIFIGGTPASTISAVMPLPEGMPEVTFAGILGSRRFRHTKKDGYRISTDADFVITGEIHPNDIKQEGPFGDHLGYYSLVHDFPVMKIDKVYHRKDAILPFTAVGRPPQEDSIFGKLIHKITSPVVPSTLPGVHSVHAVDSAGVHPLLLALGSERYTPFKKSNSPQELLTIANSILGFGQMSLAKYLMIGAHEDNRDLDINNIDEFFTHILSRVNWEKDLHFQTETTIDTLDYSGTGLNSGSKLILAATGEIKRTLTNTIPTNLKLPKVFKEPKMVIPGIMVLSSPNFKNYEEANVEINKLVKTLEILEENTKKNLPLIVLTENSTFTSNSLHNFLWKTFTRSNPSHDIYGTHSFHKNKHWGCTGSLIIDARIKKHHAPQLVEDPDTEKLVDFLGQEGNELYGII